MHQIKDELSAYPYRKKGKFYLNIFILLFIISISLPLGFMFYFGSMTLSERIEMSENLDFFMGFFDVLLTLLGFLMVFFLAYGVHLYYKKLV